MPAWQKKGWKEEELKGGRWGQMVSTLLSALRNTLLEFLPRGPEAEDEEDKGTNSKKMTERSGI